MTTETEAHASHDSRHRSCSPHRNSMAVMTNPAPPPSQHDVPSDPPATSAFVRLGRWRRLNPARKYALAFLTLGSVASAAQLVLHPLPTQPRDIRATAARD